MPKLPSVVNASKITRSLQTEFGSYNHTDAACNGAIYDMVNLSSDKFPLITTRKTRKIEKKGIKGTIIAFSDVSPDCFIYRYESYGPNLDFDVEDDFDVELNWDKESWSDGDIVFRDGYSEYLVCKAGSYNSDAPRQICCLGDLMLIMPDKKCYDKRDKVFCDSDSDMEFETLIENITKITYKGKWYNKSERYVDIEEIHLDFEGDDLEDFCGLSLYLALGFIVRFENCANTDINGCMVPVTDVKKNTIYTHSLVIDVNDGVEITEFSDDDEVWVSDLPGVSGDDISYISMKWSKWDVTIPDMKCICECNNRIWGCAYRTIYASALGRVFRWDTYKGLSTDSFTVESGEKTNFTGCVNYRDSVIFFTEEKMFRIYGDKPSNFQLLCIANVGLEKGSEKSLAIVGENLFFKSANGIYVYNGSVPICISGVFGEERYIEAVGGSDGIKYYVSLKDHFGDRNLFVYDTRYGVWHKEDKLDVAVASKIDGVFCMSTKNALYCIDNGSTEMTELPSESIFDWMCEFADIYEYSSSGAVPSKKGVVRFYIRCELEDGANMTAKIKYDSNDEWLEVGKVEATKKRTCILPIIPRRADHFKLRLSGKGKCTVYSITREYYGGSFI